MKKRKLHITEQYFIKNDDNLRARRLLAEFLGLDQKECRLPLSHCSALLLRFVSDYNELVIGKNEKEKDGKGYRQESLF